ncbi:MAG: hypothetical protein GF418_02840 [Chitinivibrionales bacterium]|nr:hypothetical protein [Chitinivibrionales bacterium]MBD3394539.1 hypothetical protein [Chitinivibrionales bacterium]
MFGGLLGAVYDIRILGNRLAVRPFAGVTSTGVLIRDVFTLDPQIFKGSESEFGLTAGIEPCVTIGRFQVTLPAGAEYVFSSPRPFVTTTVSLNAGVLF